MKGRESHSFYGNLKHIATFEVKRLTSWHRLIFHWKFDVFHSHKQEVEGTEKLFPVSREKSYCFIGKGEDTVR